MLQERTHVGTARSSTQTHAARLLANTLSRLVSLDEQDRGLIRACSTRARELPGGVRFPVDARTRQHVVVSGWIARQHMLADGRRQIVSLILPGELVGPYPNPLVSITTVSLTDARVADVGALFEAVAQNPEKHRRLRHGLNLAQRMEEAQLTGQVMRLGRRTALERIGHWLLDVQSRLRAAGLGEGDSDSFAMPLTQETLGDVLGLSLVHVNRIIQQLRRERLIDLRAGYVTILEPERLRMITEYAPLIPPEPATV